MRREDSVEQEPRRRILGFWVGTIVLAVLTLTVGVPVWRNQQMTLNDREAETVLKYLTSAQADFRANDRDGNKVSDFWTADVSGLYSLSVGGRPLALIPKDVALADAKPLRPLLPEPVPYHGYYFVVLTRDRSVTPPALYQADTDGVSGKVHHLERFGFAAYPEKFGVTGRYVIIVNENNSLFWYHEWSGPPPTEWPDDEEWKTRLHRHCGRLPKTWTMDSKPALATSSRN